MPEHPRRASGAASHRDADPADARQDASGAVLTPSRAAALLGQPSPTDQQAEVTGAGRGPLLVVAGAGAGKTATMAARVVWLVANGLADPDQVLGLTFTRKAAQQLGRKIRGQLAELAGVPSLSEVDPSGALARRLADAAPTASTYDSFAGSVIREFGLLLPVEPTARIIGKAELFTVASRIVEEHTGILETDVLPDTVVEMVLKLNAEMDNHHVSADALAAEARAFEDNVVNLPKAPRQRDQLSQKVQRWIDTQRLRVALLPLVDKLRRHLDDNGLTTFPRQMSQAARLARDHPAVGRALRRRFRVVMLDEYQDTSYSQRLLLRSLFGDGADEELTVNAVGDPMQAIYGWRGASAANLMAFPADFPAAGGPAGKAELTISFRNPSRVLAAANAVSETLLGAPGSRGRVVAPLTPFGDAPGEVRLGWYETIAQERAAAAEEMAGHYRSVQEARENWRAAGDGTEESTEPRFTGALLIRKNSQAAPLAAELAARGVPAEIVGVGGLLDVPEVADVVALATMLVRPQDNAAALRVLSGPLVGLSVADLKALGRRAEHLAGRTRAADAETAPQDGSGPDAAVARLIEEIDEALPPEADQVVGLADAVADLGEAVGVSETGVRRLRALSALLRRLRTRSLGKPLPELFADIEAATGLRTEVLARQDPAADGAPGTAHLDRLAEEVAAFAAVPGASLPRLLDYFALAREHDDGLTPGEVTVRSDRVQILTVHKAKGLEWDHVGVVHADAKTWESQIETFLTKPDRLPPELRGDAEDIVTFDVDAENRKEFEDGADSYRKRERATLAEEATRLFYVAVTRAGQTLSVTGSAFNDTAAKPAEPYAYLSLLARHDPQAVVAWFDPDEQTDADEQTNADARADADGRADAASASDPTAPPHGEDPPALFPALEPDPGQVAAAQEVTAARESLPPLHEDELSRQWEADATALIEERRALDSPVVDVELSGRLTASDVVNLKRDPEAFARRQRRPVPFKPNAYAKRGTAFHAWLEERFGAQSLIDEDQLPGLGEEEVTPAELAHLKDRFLASPWAGRTPEFVEHPFELALGASVVRGRMDAVFRDPDSSGWIIVDWKTGAPPKGAALRAAAVQLAVYRTAFEELLAARGRTAEPVRAAFHYVGANHTLEPAELPGRAELEALLDVG